MQTQTAFHELARVYVIICSSAARDGWAGVSLGLRLQQVLLLEVAAWSELSGFTLQATDKNVHTLVKIAKSNKSLKHA